MKKENHMVSTIIAIFVVVIILSFSILRVNLLSVYAVNEKTESLINNKIVQLKKISDLQNIVSQLVINLHSYYANIDSKFHEINLNLISSVKIIFTADSDLFETQIQEELFDNLIEFEKFSLAFHKEMLKISKRNWDELREHLYHSQTSSNKILALLEQTNENIKSDLKKQGNDTLIEITTLSQYQILFILSLLLIFIYMICVLLGRIKDQNKLYKLAFYDQITQLPNKVSYEKVTRKKENSDKYKQGLLIVDLDRYKLITGRFGHVIGEKYIQKISDTLKKIENDIKTQVTIYQFTTTSWLIDVIQFQDVEALIELADQILNLSSSSLDIENNNRLSFSFSIGIAIDINNNKSRVDLIREADAALNLSIEEGGNCFNVYSEVMGKQIKQYVDIDQALRHAISNNEFSLYFQPKITVQTGEISGSEVLLRWKYDNEFISPNIFIPIAEKSDLIAKIGNWVLEKACLQWMSWYKQGLKSLPIAVNVSAVQFQDPYFPMRVKDILKKTGMPAHMLELEITEEAAAENPTEVIRIMKILKSAGVGLAIDDFGTGYCSLSYLKCFPLDVLKIDQSFIRDMNTSSSDASIVKLIVDLAKQLNYRIVAEGVETEAHYMKLRNLKCDYMQGYYFSKPVEASEFIHILESTVENSDKGNQKSTLITEI